MDASKDTGVFRGGPRRVIKRYSNRKLYDTRDSRYVTLQQIGEMVRAGEEVQIIDNKTKEDKTEVTLALILSEDLRAQPRSVPLAALRDLIQERGEKLLTQLREGTLGRFMPPPSTEQESSDGAGVVAPPKVVEPSAAELEAEARKEEDRKAEERRGGDERKGRLTELMESSISSLDERIRAIVPSAKSFAELRDQVAALEAKVAELSAQVAELQKNSGKPS
jgi:polyhydroxyalkanoate synthesis repressor PhaR